MITYDEVICLNMILIIPACSCPKAAGIGNFSKVLDPKFIVRKIERSARCQYLL